MAEEDATAEAQGPPPEPQANGSRAPAGGERADERSRLVRKNREMRAQRRRLRIGLAAASVALGAVAAALAAWGIAQERRSQELEGQLLLARASLAEARSGLEAADREREQLVEGRIPGLQPLEYDRVIPLADGAVRHVSFNLTRSREAPLYEYHLVVHNPGAEAIEPWVSVVLFDRLGIEIGRSRVGSGLGDTLHAASSESRVLMPGEIRSYSGRVDVQSGEVPAYFLIVSE